MDKVGVKFKGIIFVYSAIKDKCDFDKRRLVVRAMKKEDYCNRDGIYAENEYFILKRLCEQDKEDFMELVLDTSSIPKAYEQAGFSEYSWECSLNDADLNLSLFAKDTGIYLGNLMLKNLSGSRQEIGIDIVRKYRKRGIGYKAVRLLIEHAAKVSGRSDFEVRIYSDNEPSRRLFEKLGAVEIGQECSEFISAMKAMEATVGEEKMSQLTKCYKDVFEAADRHHIIVYELRI